MAESSGTVSNASTENKTERLKTSEASEEGTEEGITLTMKSSSTNEVDFLEHLTEAAVQEEKSLFFSETTGSEEVESETSAKAEFSESLDFGSSEGNILPLTTTVSESSSAAHTSSILSTSHISTDSNMRQHVTNNVTLTSSEIHIDLPIYFPNSSETPESFLKYYTTKMHTVIVDDEATDRTVEEGFGRMGAGDFNLITEFPTTIENAEVGGHNNIHLYSAEIDTSRTVHNESSLSLATSAAIHENATETQVSHEKATFPSVTTASLKHEKTSSAENIIPEDLQSNYLSNACSASDYQGGSGCFCIIDEMLKKLNHALRDKNLSQEIDTFTCESFFKVNEGLLITNETVEGRVKRSYLFIKQQQEVQVFKRETVPNNEIESVLKGTTNIQNSGKRFMKKYKQPIQFSVNP